MKSLSDIKPCTLLNAGGGRWLYNYNIIEVVKDEKKSYECDQIEIIGEATYEKLVLEIIREKYTESAELSIVNKYNAHILKITINTDAVEQYRQLLLFVASVKEMVKTDLQITN
jgi:hypothetical protein